LAPNREPFIFIDMNNKLLPWLLLFCALGLSSTAAYYSVIGLSIVFSGVALPVIIMGSFLEISKLSIATYLHNQWKNSMLGLKIYLTAALVVLSIITSIGIYGLLSKGFRENITQLEISGKQVKNIEIKKERFEQSKQEYVLEKQNVDKDISGLRDALATGTTTQYKDRETGQIITINSSSARKTFEKQLTQAIANRDTLSRKIETMNDSLTALDIQILDMETQNEEANELGVIQAVSESTGWSLSSVANLFILILIIVFDPLAISLVLATNQAFKNSKPKKNMYGEIKQEPKIQPTIKVQPTTPPPSQPIVPDAQVELEKQMNKEVSQDAKKLEEQIRAKEQEIARIQNSTVSSKKKGLALTHLGRQLKDLQNKKDNQIEY
jgi:hypothetical protein